MFKMVLDYDSTNCPNRRQSLYDEGALGNLFACSSKERIVKSDRNIDSVCSFFGDYRECLVYKTAQRINSLRGSTLVGI